MIELSSLLSFALFVVVVLRVLSRSVCMPPMIFFPARITLIDGLARSCSSSSSKLPNNNTELSLLLPPSYPAPRPLPSKNQLASFAVDCPSFVNRSSIPSKRNRASAITAGRRCWQLRLYLLEHKSSYLSRLALCI